MSYLVPFAEINWYHDVDNNPSHKSGLAKLPLNLEYGSVITSRGFVSMHVFINASYILVYRHVKHVKSNI